MARADYTVTFTAPKIAQVLAPNCDSAGEWRVDAIGSPPALFEADDSIFLSLLEPRMFRQLLAPRPRDSNKGLYGHVLVIAGSPGKTGAASMCGIAALRAGAGLVTVASAEAAIPVIASHAPELMTEVLDPARIDTLTKNKTLVAIGPGLGTAPATVEFVRDIVARLAQPMVIDADGLNALAGAEWSGAGRLRVLTPHPGEMSVLTELSKDEIQENRLETATKYAKEWGHVVVLKGAFTVIAAPDGRATLIPVASPALARAGTGDVLAGLIVGLRAQGLDAYESAVAGAWIHAQAGLYAADDLGTTASVLAGDVLNSVSDVISDLE